jgi:hypothetical protein
MSERHLQRGKSKGQPQCQPQGQSMIEVLILATGLVLVLGLSSGPLSGLVRAITLNYSRFVEALSLP